MTYPNAPFWSALKDGARVRIDDKDFVLSVVQCGELVMPSGKLVACDPFVFLAAKDNCYVQVPPGRHPVQITLADVSGVGDGSHMREAYATLLLDTEADEAERRIITPPGPGTDLSPTLLEDGSFIGFPVDTGTACFADGQAIENCMPPGDWYEELFENKDPASWFKRMDDPNHIRTGIANIPLPLAGDGENIVIFHSGWGDGFYPIVGGFDENGRLVRVHVDFLVVFRD